MNGFIIAKPVVQQYRKWIKRISERTQSSFIRHGGGVEKQVQDSTLILLTELSMLSSNLEMPLWIALNNHRTLISPIFQAWMYSNSFDLQTRKKWVTHPSRCPFSISSLTMTYSLSIGQEKSFALAHLTINFLTREIYFPGNGKGQCILRKPWKMGHSLNNPCLSLSSL